MTGDNLFRRIAAATDRDGGMSSLLRRVLGTQSALLFLLLALLVIFFSLMAPKRSRRSRMRGTSRRTQRSCSFGGRQHVRHPDGGIDLSINGVLIISGVVAAKVIVAVGGDSAFVNALGFVAAIGTGLAWGALNGFLVAKSHIPALIVTLGTLGMSLGASLLLTNGIDIPYIPMSLVLSWVWGRSSASRGSSSSPCSLRSVARSY